MKKTFLLFAFGLSMAVLAGSCGDTSSALLTDEEMQQKADSIYMAELDNLKVHADSLCDINFDMYVQQGIDSILRVDMPELQ